MGSVPEDHTTGRTHVDLKEYLRRLPFIVKYGAAITWPDIPELADHWLKELQNVGLPDTKDQAPGSLAWRGFGEGAMTTPHDDLHSVRLDNGERLWLRFDARRSVRGYKRVEVMENSSRSDKAIIAALTVLETRPVDLAQLPKTLSIIKPPLTAPLLLYALDEARRLLSEEHGWLLPESQENGYVFRRLRALVPKNVPGRYEDAFAVHMAATLDQEFAAKFQQIPSLQYVVSLLRYYRPGFVDLRHEEQIALIKQACVHLDKFLDALRKFVGFLEYGAIGKDLRPEVENAGRDVEAAVLKDVDGLKLREIAQELGVSISLNAKAVDDYSTVGKMVARGRRLLQEVLGEGGWRERAEAMRAEGERWRSLSEAEQAVERIAEDWNVNLETARLYLWTSSEDSTG